jgi:hypothetical protein
MARSGSSLPLRLLGMGSWLTPVLLALSVVLWAAPVWAAFASVGSLCSSASKIAGTTQNHTTTASLEAGNLGIIAYASDNLATSDGASNTHLSVTDIAGNTWTKAREFTNAQTGAGTGVTVSIWYSKAATTLTSGTNRITMTFSGSVTAKAMACWEFTMAANSVVKVDGGADLANDGADTAAITRGGLTNVSHLWIRASGGEYGAGGSTYTASTNFTTFTHTTSHTGGGAADSNITGRGEFRIFTGTSQTTDPTVGGAVDHAATMAAFSESVCSVAEPSYVAVNAQPGQATVYWASANSVILLRKTSPFVATDVPKHGTIYAANGSVGAATVIYNGTVSVAGDPCSATSCTDTGLTNGTTYYYKVFARSAVSGTPCYSAGTVNPTNGVTAVPKLVGATWPVPWSFAMAGGAMMRPGIVGADGSISTGSNANWIFSLDAAAGVPRWTPVSTGQAVQSWLTWLPVGSGWSSATWPKRKLIRIDQTKVGSGGVTDFPVLVVLSSDADLQASAQANGNDIVFTASDGTTKLSHEIERYDGATGELIAWVKVPSLSSTADTDIYMYYGNATAGNQQNPTDVWSNGYVGVWHLKETPTGAAGEVKDSTEYAGHGTAWNMAGADRVAGKVGYAYKFIAGASGAGSLVYTGDRPAMQLPIYSWSMWIRGDSQPVCNAGGTNGQPIWNADSQFNFGWQHTGCAFNQAAAHTDGEVESAAGWKSVQIASVNPLVATTWYHVAATYDGTTLRVYRDGMLEASAPHGPPIAVAGSFSFGNGGDNVARFTNFAGQLDEVRVGGSVRSDAWMLTEYNNQNSPATFHSVVGGEQAGTWTPSTPCTSCSYVVGGDQSGKVYSVDELTGNTKWSVDFSAAGLNRANNIQAAVGAQLHADSNAAFQSAYAADVVFAASRNTGATNCGAATNNNKVFAINMADGAVLWTFNNTCGAAPAGGAMDYVTGMPYVDYGRNRLYVTSGDAGATQRSLWIIKTVDGEGVLKGQVMTCAACSGLGVLDTSPTLGSDGNTLYFGNTAGRLYAFDVNTLAIRWYRDLGAAIKGFVWDGGAGNLYLSTTNTVWRVQDNFNDTGAANSSDNVRSTVQWQRTVTGASMPLLLSNAVYVGSSSDFLLHEIALDNSSEKTLALDSTAVGDVSTDDGTNVYVSTAAGKLYKIQVPLP